jgi:hypothetical protein
MASLFITTYLTDHKVIRQSMGYETHTEMANVKAKQTLHSVGKANFSASACPLYLNNNR